MPPAASPLSGCLPGAARPANPTSGGTPCRELNIKAKDQPLPATDQRRENQAVPPDPRRRAGVQTLLRHSISQRKRAGAWPHYNNHRRPRQRGDRGLPQSARFDHKSAGAAEALLEGELSRQPVKTAVAGRLRSSIRQAHKPVVGCLTAPAPPGWFQKRWTRSTDASPSSPGPHTSSPGRNTPCRGPCFG